MTIAARLLQGRKRIYSGQQGLFAAQPMSLRYSAAQKFSFVAPLRTSVFLERGVGAASYTRATVATVKDFEGNIRNCLSGEVRFAGQRRVRNWLAVPEDFSSATWTTIAGGTGTVPTKTANYASAPDGTMTACRVQATVSAGTAGGDYSLMRQSATYTDTGAVGSVWMKSNTGASQGVIVSYDEVVVVTVTTSWQRFSWPRTIGSNHFDIGCRGDSAANKTVDVLVWHPQMEALVGASNQNPSEYVSVGAAKLNEFTNSEDLTAVASWAPTRTTVTANGYQTLDTVLETAVVNTHELASAAISGISASTAYRLQFECKANGRDESWVQVSDGTQGAYGVFNATTGAFTTAWQGFGAAAFTGCASSIESRGDGVYRVTLDFTTAASTAAITTTFYLYNAGTSYLGDVAKGWYLGKLMLRRGTGDYFAVGNVYPYHGACVDGVKYFDTQNGNTVASNVVTEAVGRSLDGYSVAQFPGNATSYFSTPHSTANQLTGEFVLEAYVAPSSWAAAALQTIVSKYATTGNAAFLLQIINATGKLRLLVKDTTGVSVGHDSSVSISLGGGVGQYVKASFDPANARIRFFTGPTRELYTQLGTDVATTRINVDPATTYSVQVGAWGGGSDLFNGSIYRVMVFNSLTATTPVLDFNPREHVSGNTWVSSTGETWTRNGGATIFHRTAEGYLPEGATTNLVLQSSNFGTTWDSTGGGTPTRSAAAAYVGDIALDLLGDDDAGTAEYFRQVVTFTADASKSVSFVVKQGSATTSLFKLSDDTAATSRMTCEVTWSSGVPVATFSVGSQERQPEALANGGYRIFGLAAGVLAANTNRIYVYPANTAAGSATATGTIYVGGVQAENATVASSLQPTTTATVARNADVLTYPAAGNVNESGGSAYLEWFQKTVPASTSQVMYQIDDGSNVDILNSFVVNTTATFRNQTLAASVATGDTQTAGTISALASHKGAGRFTTNSFRCCLDGTLGTEDTSGALPTGLTLINVGSRTVGAAPFYAVMKNLRIAQVALSNQELVALTA